MSTILFGGSESFVVSWCADDYGFNSFRDEELQAQEANRSRSRYQGSVSQSNRSQFNDCLYGCRKGLAHCGFFQAERGRNLVHLIGTKHHIPGKGAVDSVTHTATSGAENEVALTAILTFATRHRGGSKAGDAITQSYSLHLATNFNDGPGEF